MGGSSVTFIAIPCRIISFGSWLAWPDGIALSSTTAPSPSRAVPPADWMRIAADAGLSPMSFRSRGTFRSGFASGASNENDAAGGCVIVGGGPAGSHARASWHPRGCLLSFSSASLSPAIKSAVSSSALKPRAFSLPWGWTHSSLGGALIGTVRLVFEHEIVETTFIRGHRVDPARAGRGTLEASRSERRQGPTRSCGRWNCSRN